MAVHISDKSATGTIEPEKLPMKLRIQKIIQLFAAVNSSLENGTGSLAAMDTLLDCLTVLFEECNTPILKRDKHILEFTEKYKPILEELYRLRVTKDEFQVIRVIGRGGFGDVEVVRHKNTNEIYAMKTLKKKEMLQQENTAFFKEERSILSSHSNQWLTALHYAFQDRDRLYLVMDYHPGGDLLSLLSKYDDVFEEPMARFYLGEIALAIQSLHELGFIHRDIKPDNVLIDATGHVKLADFGSSAWISKDGLVLSEMAIGTPDYMPPEVLNASKANPCKQGKESDWWSFGAVMYEMLFGNTPFYAESLMGTYSNIMNAQTYLTFPDEIESSAECKDLIRSLFVSIETRLGFEEIKKHDFFSSFDWENIRLTVSPYIPELKGLDDTSNFDEFRPQVNVDPVDRSTGFSGKQLPFVGFTFTRGVHTSCSGDESPFELMSPLRAPCSVHTNDSKFIGRSDEELILAKQTLKEAQDEKNNLQKTVSDLEIELNDLQKSSDIQRSCNTVMIGELSEVREELSQLKESFDSLRKEYVEKEKACKLQDIDLKDVTKKYESTHSAYLALIEQTRTRELNESSEMNSLRQSLKQEREARSLAEKKLNVLEKDELLNAYKIEELQSYVIDKSKAEACSNSPSKFTTANLQDRPVEQIIGLFEKKNERIVQLKGVIQHAEKDFAELKKTSDIEILKLTQTNQQQGKLIDFLQTQGATPKKKPVSRKYCLCLL